MSSFIRTSSSNLGHPKSIRVWGTNEPSTNVTHPKQISKDVTIQHWSFPDGTIPGRLLLDGYNVINSEQAFLYLDGKTSYYGQFPHTINESLIWSDFPLPVVGGSSNHNIQHGWAPNIFSAVDGTNNTHSSNPGLQGALFALWNDWGNNATTPLEIYYQLSRSIPLIAERSWAGARSLQDRPHSSPSSELTRKEFDLAYPVLNAAAPGQNLNQAVKTKAEKGAVIFEYDLGHLPLVKPQGAAIKTGVPSVGPPYAFDFELMVLSGVVAERDAILLSGLDNTLSVQLSPQISNMKNVTLTFTSYGQSYPITFAMPVDRFIRISIHATREYTYADIDSVGGARRGFGLGEHAEYLEKGLGKQEQRMWWTSSLDIWGDHMQTANMSFAAPSASISTDISGVRLGRVSLRLDDSTSYLL
jgi:hexosaminidase